MKKQARVKALCGAALTALILSASPLMAQETAQVVNAPVSISERSTPVAVDSKGTDSIGAKLSTRLKEMFNSSNLFVFGEADAPKIRLHITTAPEFPSRPGLGSAYSVVWTFSMRDSMLPHYLEHEVGVLGPDEVDDVAAKIVERTDGMAARYKYLFSNQSN